MVSEVIITELAQNQLDSFIEYLLFDLSSPQAAKSLKEDALLTADTLINVADTLSYCYDEDLKSLGYRIIHFLKHKYLYMYRIIGNTAYIEAIYHQLQDYENTFKNEIS